MRPPLYPVFLAGSIVLVDSLVQNLRLVQAVISAATIPFVYLLALEVAWGVGRLGPASRRVALAAALLAALSYTLAANAAELLTETVFLFGLTVALWLIVRAGRTGSWRTAALAGLGLGALCLVRSVALPLVPLGAVWLLISAKRKAQSAKRPRALSQSQGGSNCRPSAQPLESPSAACAPTPAWRSARCLPWW
jgi:4-amino-4-deoxy-L-arabinose transferase-like glycosyltransferase